MVVIVVVRVGVMGGRIGLRGGILCCLVPQHDLVRSEAWYSSTTDEQEERAVGDRHSMRQAALCAGPGPVGGKLERIGLGYEKAVEGGTGEDGRLGKLGSRAT